MKARDYYEKYGSDILYDYRIDAHVAARDLFLEISDEVVDICKKRNVSSNSAFASVMKEINDKWNAICRLFVKFHGFSPLQEDGFINSYLDKMPELQDFLK